MSKESRRLFFTWLLQHSEYENKWKDWKPSDTGIIITFNDNSTLELEMKQ